MIIIIIIKHNQSLLDKIKKIHKYICNIEKYLIIIENILENNAKKYKNII